MFFFIVGFPSFNEQQPSKKRNVETTTEFITIDYPTKTALQMELLQLQIVAVKREIYSRELDIFQKERSMHEQEKGIVKETYEKLFS